MFPTASHLFPNPEWLFQYVSLLIAKLNLLMIQKPSVFRSIDSYPLIQEYVQGSTATVQNSSLDPFRIRPLGTVRTLLNLREGVTKVLIPSFCPLATHLAYEWLAIELISSIPRGLGTV